MADVVPPAPSPISMQPFPDAACMRACSTCIVEINEGLESTTIRSLDESSTLRDNPANYRLSCVTNMYDDVTVTVFPPVGAAQWTR